MDRIVVSRVRPVVDDGQWPAKTPLGAPLRIEATVFAGGGNNEVAAEVEITDPDGLVAVVPLSPVNPGLDRWAASWTPRRPGRHRFSIVAWDDRAAFHRARVQRKGETGRDPADELDGLLALARSVPQAAVACAQAEALGDNGSVADRLLACRELLTQLDPLPVALRRFSRRVGPWPVSVEPTAALRGAWYQFFPRSEGTAGTLRSATTAVDRAAELGFTVVYLPPVHPIGRTHRKGPGDTEGAGPHDPGSPWAIGAAEGGHDAVHPELGTEDDLLHLVRHARQRGMEVALDYALNFSPDHPWVTEHPEWFTRRGDGTFIPAGTADKYYPDIYTLDFDGPHAAAVAAACERVLRYWIARGIRIFRVDLPHTKPLWFWERLLADVRRDGPELVFLAEAFTKPTMMHWLSKVGFSQSLTYYLWRETPEEIADYLSELHGEQADYLWPNLFVNSHDYLPPYLRDGDWSVFALRAALAATGSPSWGMYAGYELLENTPREPGGTKYAESETFQVRHRDFTAPPLAAWVRALNRIRAQNPALHELGNLRHHPVQGGRALFFSRSGEKGIVLVLASFDRHDTTLTVRFTPADVGWPPREEFTVVDEFTGQPLPWRGDTHTVALSPGRAPVRVLSLRRT